MNQEPNKVEREVIAVLPSGEERVYSPTHLPVIQETNSRTAMLWEEEDGSLFSVVFNLERLVALEMVSRREDQEPEILDLLDKAKSGEADEGEDG